MKAKIELKIVTPEKIIYDDIVEGVSLPTVEGEITILPHHIPLISAVSTGELKIKKDGKYEYFSIIKGVVEVDGKTITILTNAAERAEEIDEERAEEARTRAKELMQKEKGSAEEYADAVAHLERAISRLRIAKKHRPRGHTPSIDQSA